MIRASEVNDALIQHAASELEVGVPIRSWRVEDGELVLMLAYGGEARWTEGEKPAPSKASKASKPWRFVESARKEGALPVIPDGDLGKLRKRELELLLQAWGYQTETLAPLKAEFVEALTWLRDGLNGGKGNG